MDRAENYAEKYLSHLLDGDRLGCSSLAKAYLETNHSFIDLYEEVFKQSLYKVGILWEQNKISVATEHIATAVTEGILNEFFAQIIPSEKYNKKIVLACVENERHQVGIRMVADVFEMNGWDSYFLGAGIPVNELVKYIHEISPDLLAISFSVYFNARNFFEMIWKVQADFPKLKILVGGQAIKYVKDEINKEFNNVVLIPDLYFLERFIKSLKTSIPT